MEKLKMTCEEAKALAFLVEVLKDPEMAEALANNGQEKEKAE
jgi:hypothetical protein